MLTFLLGSVVFGIGGFVASRLFAGAGRTIVDNLAVLVTGVFVAGLLCLLINIEWVLDWRKAGLISFAYCFFWDRGRMIQEMFPENR
ncbi:hypothetical protein [Microbulbifer sp.]|uniref:hypothetical protein n=1 Tax=Microbulbifer sp. TaxID=1908541 RepID=UPI003F339FF8